MMRLLLALSSLAAAARAQQVMSRRLLPDALVTGLGARCMDGSAGGYFVLRAAGANASKLVIFIEGGGECRTSEECVAWHGSHASNSSQWAPSRTPQPQSEMSTDCSENPDFCTWSKVFIPYCTGDMHSGQQTARNPALANYYYSGHLQIVGVAADLKASGAPLASPSHVLVVGSSAGGIGALMHTDFFAEQWPSAVVKGAPECGFFYAGVTAADDLSKGEATPAAHLGFTPEWKPYLPSACAAATGNNMSQCTDAHYLYPHLKQPIFIRENQYDTAKLANCGWDGSNAAYLKLWGEWMRAELGVIAQSPKDGFFSAACLEHGGNFGWASSPVINGVTMQAAMRNWYFELGNRSLHYTYDDCAESGGSGLPCTAVDAESQQRCPHWASSPGGGVSAQCLSELGKDCPGLRGKGQSCGQCVRAHGAFRLPTPYPLASVQPQHTRRS